MIQSAADSAADFFLLQSELSENLAGEFAEKDMR